MTQNEVHANKPAVISRRISIIYHNIFVDDPYSLSDKKSEFWDEFFMLKPRSKELQLLLKNCDAEILHFLTLKCIQYIKLPEDAGVTAAKENTTSKREEIRKRRGTLQTNTVSSWDAARIGNAYTTLSILIESTCHYPDFISLLFGCCSVVDDPKDNKLRLFITHLQEILGKDISIDENIRECALLCMVSCVTCLKTQVNPFLEHFFKTPLVENLLQLLVGQRYVHGRLIITFLSSLILHKDYYDQGSCNPYQVQISLCENQPQLVAITAHIMQRLQHAVHRFLNYDELIKQAKIEKNNVNSENSTQINEQIIGQMTEQQISDSRKTSSESFSNLITNTKNGDDISRTSSLKTTQLSSQQLDQSATSPANGVFSWIGKLLFSPENDSAKQNKGKLKLSSKGYDIYSEALEVLFLHESVQLNRHFIPIIALCSPDRFQFKEGELLSQADSVETTTVIGNSSEKRANYFIPDTCALSVFIEYTSIVMQNTRGILSSNPTKDNSSNLVAICFNVLALIVQDMYACSFLFDQKNQFSLSIYKTPMRHRKHSFGDKEDKSANNGVDSVDSQSNTSKPLACWVLQLCLEFLVSNLTKINFPLDIYSRVINVIHRLLIHQKRLGQRLPMAFSHLWHALVVL